MSHFFLLRCFMRSPRPTSIIQPLTSLFSFLQWNISDYFYQNREKIIVDLTREAAEEAAAGGGGGAAGKGPTMPPFDALWMCLYSRLGDLCVDSRPAVRKSAGQTLFSTIAAHGVLLQQSTWQIVLWMVSC